jgi:hypothetical protein
MNEVFTKPKTSNLKMNVHGIRCTVNILHSVIFKQVLTFEELTGRVISTNKMKKRHKNSCTLKLILLL